jgi:alkanesulfonate monooxygenase SsuD/methylene tetrahydromethanopterin reductase-like flavin-dependent oxidoreductase (luciferase family)
MPFGIFGINFGPCADPDGAVSVTRLAEQAGFDSVWTGEHVELPDSRKAPSPAHTQTEMLDPSVALSFVAAHTESIRLRTDTVILPQRNPGVLAKEMASVDVLSRGRLMLGVAAGYLHQEFAVRAPHPVQRPSPPIVVGRHSAVDHRRSARQCNDWYGFALNVESTRAGLEGLDRAREETTRPADFGELEISITPPSDVSSEDVERYSKLGADWLILLVNGRTVEDTCARISRAAATLIAA